MRLYLARHGESTGNAERLIFGQRDYPLTEKGRAQARALERSLEGARIERGCTPKGDRICRMAIGGLRISYRGHRARRIPQTDLSRGNGRCDRRVILQYKPLINEIGCTII